MGVLIFLIFCIAGIGFLVFVLVAFMYESKRRQTENKTLTERISPGVLSGAVKEYLKGRPS